jgi:hypothetical protein
MPRHSLFCFRIAANRHIGRAVFAALFFSSVTAANAATDQFSFNNAGGEASGYSSDACGSSYASLTVAANGAKNLSSPSANNVAFGYITRFDTCNHVLIYAYGFVSGITLSGISAANGGQLPNSIAASGQVPLYAVVYSYPDFNFVNSYTDTLTFQLGLSRSGFSQNFSGTSQRSVTNGASPSKTVFSEVDRIDENFGYATVTSSSLSTNTLAAPTLSSAVISNYSQRTITINH